MGKVQDFLNKVKIIITLNFEKNLNLRVLNNRTRNLKSINIVCFLMHVHN